MVETRGQIQITSKRLYFQPFHNQSSSPMIRFNLSDIRYIYKRRHIMRHIALECVFESFNQTMSPRSNAYRKMATSVTSNASEEQHDTLLLCFEDTQVCVCVCVCVFCCLLCLFSFLCYFYTKHNIKNTTKKQFFKILRSQGMKFTKYYCDNRQLKLQNRHLCKL